jgi:hypothetical protein
MVGLKCHPFGVSFGGVNRMGYNIIIPSGLNNATEKFAKIFTLFFALPPLRVEMGRDEAKLIRKG